MAASQRVRAVLDVALRVPPVFIIDAILNSPHDASAGYLAVLCQLFLTLLGILASTVVLVLSRRALFKFYTISMALVIAATSVLVNYYTTLHMSSNSAYKLELLPASGPSLWMPLIVLQLIFGIGFVTLLEIQSTFSQLIIVNLMVPTVGFVLELPADVQETLVIISGLVLAIYTTVCLLLRFKWFYYSTKYTVLLLKHMYQVYGLQVMIEDAWKKIHFPDVLRVFWLTRLATQAVFLVYMVKVSRASTGETSYFIPWNDFWELVCNLIISGCDSTLTVLGMSAVISSIAHYLGLGILSFIGSTEEEDKRLGFVAPVLFFILALQTGLSGLQPEERLVRLCRNMCLLLTAILHFIHGMTDPVLMSLSASHVSSFRRHFPVLLVSAFLFVLPVLLSCVLWHFYVLNTWLFAVTAFCIELCLKVIVSLTVYTLFMIDGHYSVVWEKLDDYVYYVRSTGSIVEFIFGVIMFGNGAYTMMFESGSKIRACMMCLHAYFNIYLQAKNGWKTFVNRRTAVKKINSLPELQVSESNEIDDVCAICYQEFRTSARVTPCHHYFHALCLRKWLYIQDTCPMCHQKVYIDDDPKESSTFSNNNGNLAPNEEPVADVGDVEVEQELNDQDLSDEEEVEEEEEEEWTAEQHHSATEEEESINDVHTSRD
ncbi:PREDICTED: E3 ubiquitin-protein ligase RNF139 [Nanorana parkeri]|uniref:E3 ubiquitin-protein ligase RNF139 n=1 Tax=Nanorana parkeri TaxID=125878 RepID=UPI0008545B41|nr:PREDICTED: E3 ubiquitin-protein ligase RNF139 [Nanorana parkeri]